MGFFRIFKRRNIRLSAEGITAGKQIYRAVNILTSISHGVTSLTDIAENCQLNKATAYRLLKILEKTNMVKQDSMSRQYMLGRLFTQFVSAPLVPHRYLIRCADAELKHLATFTQETVHLDIMNGISDMILTSIPSTHVLRIVEETRESDYLHAGATGKVLLSQLDNKDLRIALKHAHLKQFTEHTVVHADELMVQIKRIREQGYGISFNERIMGVVAICTPINNYVVPAVISVLGPEDRLKPRINEILTEMKKSCTNICRSLQELPEVDGVNSTEVTQGALG
jgi:DNA-binding IclR family transcriptional regulator